jgi:hypothetical protein
MVRLTLALAGSLALGLVAVGPVAGGGPTRVSDAYTETFFDDFILDLCGIETMTTVTERWTLKEFADGSSILHVTRTFVPEDPRLPIEKGAGTAFTTPDGTRTVVGLPLLLFGSRGTIVVAAGQTIFAEEVTVRGTNPDLSDLAQYYCP